MNDTTAQILAQARAREARRDSLSPPPPDYKAAQQIFVKQTAALKRAVTSGDTDKIVAACRDAVTAWSTAPFNGAWPDDWARWQRALDDALPWNARVELGDLRA